jgi:hypothetical protein
MHEGWRFFIEKSQMCLASSLRFVLSNVAKTRILFRFFLPAGIFR